MITEDICKALYALPGGVVTPRRRTIVIPAVAAAVGVVLLIINFLAIDDSDSITAMTLISIIIRYCDRGGMDRYKRK